jgi:uncharacterized protein YegP (UPF0339 family)
MTARSLEVEYFVGNDAKWRFRVRAGNGEPMAQSEGYERLSDAENAVAVMTHGLATAKIQYHQPTGLGATQNALAYAQPFYLTAGIAAPKRRPSTFLGRAVADASRRR